MVLWLARMRREMVFAQYLPCIKHFTHLPNRIHPGALCVDIIFLALWWATLRPEKKKKVLTAELRIRPRLPYSPSWILRIPTFESSAKMHFVALPPAHHPLGAFH